MDKQDLRIEDGIVIGTASDKYTSKNPIARKLIEGFDRGVASLASQVDPEKITEVGCGEGHVTKILLENTRAPILALDLSATVIDEAREYVDSDRVEFEQCNIYDTSPERHQADLVVCCEVLEHLDDPRLGLEKLAALATSHVLLSVPREPIWRALNMARGAYLGSLGNTPGHFQHWSKRGFVAFIAPYFEILDMRTPLPWTMLLARKK